VGLNENRSSTVRRFAIIAIIARSSVVFACGSSTGSDVSGRWDATVCQ
jgi:hypothetical protein